MDTIARKDDDPTTDQKHAPVVDAAAATDASSKDYHPRRPLSKRILSVLWDSLDKDPEERKFVAKINWWILTYCCVAYFVKYLDETNVSISIITVGNCHRWV